MTNFPRAQSFLDMCRNLDKASPREPLLRQPLRGAQKAFWTAVMATLDGVTAATGLCGRSLKGSMHDAQPSGDAQ